MGMGQKDGCHLQLPTLLVEDNPLKPLLPHAQHHAHDGAACRQIMCCSQSDQQSQHWEASGQHLVADICGC